MIAAAMRQGLEDKCKVLVKVHSHRRMPVAVLSVMCLMELWQAKALLMS